MGATAPGVPGVSANLRVNVEGLRDHRGVIRFCLTRLPNYMDCKGDGSALRRSIPATGGEVMFAGMTPGEWSLMLIHDSNANGKLDKRFGIPREGFGFSGNPPISFGPPSAGNVRFAVPVGASRQNVRVRYIL